MTELTKVFLMIVLLFAFYLMVKAITKLNFCVICLSISTTWISLLILHFLGLFSNVLVIGILMGQSIVGLFYFAESKLPKKFYVFKLPFLLTLTLAVYLAISTPADVWQLLLISGFSWFITGVAYLTSNSERVGTFAKQLIECCKKW